MNCLICGAPIERFGNDHIHDPETGALLPLASEFPDVAPPTPEEAEEDQQTDPENN